MKTRRYILLIGLLMAVCLTSYGYKPPFTLYPNPVKDQLSLRFDDGEEPESVELYNLVGLLVASRRNNIESIDMSTMSSGVYTLCVTMKGGTRYHKKILKE